MDPLGEATEIELDDDVWMFALLFRLEPKAKDLKRELMTSKSKETVVALKAIE